MGIFDSPNSITVSSVTLSNIQAAVNQMNALGGGKVNLPAGDFPYNPPTGGVGVTVPAGVHLVGAGRGLTILRETVESIGSIMLQLDGTSQPINTPDLMNVQKPCLVQGISWEGLVPSRVGADNETTGTNNGGIAVNCLKDFLIYDCGFNNFVNQGIFASNIIGWEVSPYLMRGVISNCRFDDTYKDDLTIDGRIWGYGVIVAGTGHWAGTAPVRELLGTYNNNVVFIEDCFFKRNRHSIANSQVGYYVARHNYFEDMVQCMYGSYADCHGSSKGAEVYQNTFVDFPADQRIQSVVSPVEQYLGMYMGRGVNYRGGGGVIWGNTFDKVGISMTPEGRGIILNNDGGLADVPYEESRTKDVWIWSNTPNDVILEDDSVVLNQDFFMRQPNISQDGFTYVPYTYPHPLTLGIAPPVTNATLRVLSSPFDGVVPVTITRL